MGLESKYCGYGFCKNCCVCFSSGGQLAKVEELNTNIYIGNEVDVADSAIGHYWIGMAGLYQIISATADNCNMNKLEVLIVYIKGSVWL